MQVTEQDIINQLAAESLTLWPLPAGATCRLINLSENATYLVEAPDDARHVLRVHRENYHSRRAIESEIAWTDALRAEGVILTPRWLPGRDGAAVQTGRPGGGGAPRHMVMFEFVPGREPQPEEDLADLFAHLGAIAAKTHGHVAGWTPPKAFERFTWDDEAVFGPAARWGDWRRGPNVGPAELGVLEQLEGAVRERLRRFGKPSHRFGLIHADMRLANLLIDGDRTHVIDFDDCGFGWFMYDFAAAISFMEDDRQVPALKEAWVKGYQTVRPLSAADVAEIDTMVMLRRMALLAWMGTHPEVDIVQELGPTFASATARLAETFLSQSP